jgi:hypothetical protein
VWFIWTCQFMFFRSRMHRIKVGISPLLLQFPVTMSTSTFESLSTYRWVVPLPQAKFIWYTCLTSLHEVHCKLQFCEHNYASPSIIPKKTATSWKINWDFMSIITIEFYPTLLWSLSTTNENSIILMFKSSKI